MLRGGDGGMAQHGLNFGHRDAVGQVEAGEGVAAGVGAGVIESGRRFDIPLAQDRQIFVGHHSPFVPCFADAEENIVSGQTGGTFAAFQIRFHGLLCQGREGDDAEFIALAGADGDVRFVVLPESQVIQRQHPNLRIPQPAAEQR